MRKARRRRRRRYSAPRLTKVKVRLDEVALAGCKAGNQVGAGYSLCTTTACADLVS